MASKLDELMALADALSDVSYDVGRDGRKYSEMEEPRTALQSALKAVVEDAERYQWLRDPMHWTQDYLIVNETDTRFCHGEALDRLIDEDIDAARKP